MYKKTLRFVAGQCFYSIVKFLEPQKFPFGAVIGLHRVDELDDRRLQCNEAMKVTPAFLESFIIEAKSQGFRFVSIDELLRIHNHRLKAGKVLAVTLDDGYRDNYEKAFPVFRKHNVPFCIFVAPGLIDNPESCWWYMLEEIILKNDFIRFEGETYKCKTKDEKEDVFWTVRNRFAVLNPLMQKQEAFDGIDKCSEKYTQYSKNAFMTWNQLNDISRDSLCTIGAHTFNHIACVGCTFEELRDEIDMCQSSLKRHLGVEPKYFAYPYGDSLCVKSKHRILMSNQPDYNAVFLTEKGGVGYKSDMMQASRFFLINSLSAKKTVESINRTMLRPL